MTDRTFLKSSAIRWLAISLVTGCVLPAGDPAAGDPVAAGDPAAGDPGFQVVVNADNPTPSLSRVELSKIFLKKEKYPWSGGALAVPIDLRVDQAAREAFSNAIHHKPAKNIETYWQRQIFSGRAVPPPQAATVEEVFKHIRENPGGVAYVPTGTALPDWVRLFEITE